jgi:hypothetical protein
VNLAHAGIVIRQRALLEVVDLGFRFAAERGGRLFLRLGALALLPSIAVCFAAWRWLDGHPFWVWTLALGLASPAQAPFTLAAGRLMFSDQVRAREVLSECARRTWPFLAALVWTRFLIALGVVALLLFAPFAWVRGAFVHEVALLEGGSAAEAVSRAARFVQGHGRVTFEMLLAHVCLLCGAVLVGEALGQGLVQFVLQLGEPFGSLTSDGISLFSLAALFASAPLVATARFLAYVDARTRRDAWDVQVRFMALAAAEAQRVA